MMKARMSVTALAVAVLGAVAGPAFAQEHTLTYQSYGSPTWATVKTDLWFMDEVKKRSEGAIDFETYFSSSIVGTTEIIPATSQGVIDIGNVGPQYNPDLLPLSDVVQPFITTQLDAATEAVNKLYEVNEGFRNEYDSNNLKMLYTMGIPDMVISTQKKIGSPTDLEGMRIRSQSTVAQVIEAFGGTSVAMPWGESVDVFARGGLDGLASSSFDLSVAAGVHEIAAHMNDFGRAGPWATIVTVMNLDTYNNLPENLRTIVDEVAAEAPAKYLEIINQVLDEAVQTVADTETLEITVTTEEDAEAFRQKAEAELQNWIEKNEARGLPAGEVMQQYRQLVDEAEVESTYTPSLQRVLEARGG